MQACPNDALHLTSIISEVTIIQMKTCVYIHDIVFVCGCGCNIITREVYKKVRFAFTVQNHINVLSALIVVHNQECIGSNQLGNWVAHYFEITSL